MRHITKYPIMLLAVLFGGLLMAQGGLAEPVAAPLAVLENGSGAPGVGSELSSDDLLGVNGRKGVDINIEEVSSIFSSTDQTGFVGGNSIGGKDWSVTTGGNTIEAGSFANMNGVATVIQNSGNQVLIQNATVVDVMVK